MHGIGNDFIVVDRLSDGEGERDWAEVARRMCDRRFGVGADGILLVLPSRVADTRMRIFNPDGSEAEMCGNGIRCLARYFADSSGWRGDRLKVETLAGLLEVRLGDGGAVTVDMGPPHLRADEVPVRLQGGPVLDHSLAVDGRELRLAFVSMGNPHAITFIEEDPWRFPLEQMGPRVEHHPIFPNRTNFEVCQVLSPQRVTVRVWERGAGPTLACGTGACAVTVAGILKGLLRSPVVVALPGGELEVRWDGTGSVYMTGPAEYVFRGKWLQE